MAVPFFYMLGLAFFIACLGGAAKRAQECYDSFTRARVLELAKQAASDPYEYCNGSFIGPPVSYALTLQPPPCDCCRVEAHVFRRIDGEKVNLCERHDW